MGEPIKDIEIRSEEVQEILSRVPHWMIRWGSALFLGLIVLILIISWLVKYPDIISTEATITTLTPPQKEFARITGKLDSIYVKDTQEISKNTVLAVIENSANTEDVYYLKSIIDSISLKNKTVDFPIEELPILILGPIETSYAVFEDAYMEYKLNKELQPFSNEALANESSLRELKIRLQNLQSQHQLNKRELELKQNELNRNKTLLDKGVISNQDYESKQLELLNMERGLQNLRVSVSQTREAIGSANKTSKGTEINRTREETKLLRNAIQSFNQLKKSIEDWEQQYVLKSEITGKVSFLNFWSQNQTVNQGDLVFTIIPTDNQNYIAKLKAPVQNSGKIKTGQSVNIKLQNYPDTEFGMLQGKVKSISLTPNKEGFYLIDVTLPKKLITSYNKEIEFKQEMTGTAEIITEDLRLIERFFYQFKQLLDR